MVHVIPLSGSALGLAATASSTAMVHHFDQWLDVSVGIVSSAGSLGILVYPFLLDYLLMEYGWRGSLLIVAGMNLNVCVCGALMFPAPNETSQKESNAQISNRRTHQTLCGMLKELMTNKRFIFLASSCVLSLFGVSVFSSHMPAYAVTEAGLDAFQVPPLLSAMGLAGFLSRIILGFLMKSPRVSTLSLFILFNLLGGVVVACIPATKTFAGMFVLSSLFGVSFAANGPVLSRLLIIYTRLELFPIAYGYAMIACGFGFILGAPCAGKNHFPNSHILFLLLPLFLYRFFFPQTHNHCVTLPALMYTSHMLFGTSFGGFRVYRPAREGRSCVHFGGFKTIN